VVTRAKAKKIAEPRTAEPHTAQKDAPLTKFKHPWRIVPLHTAPRLAAAVTPQLTYRNGPLLTSVEVFTVFWGVAWQDANNSALAKRVNEFFDFVVTSKLIDQLDEYSVEAKTIGHGTRTGSLTVTTSEPGAKVQDAAIQKLLQTEIGAGTLPAKNANSLYFVFLPPGTQVELGGADSCTDFCGYHDATSDNIFYAAMPYPGCAGCEGGLAVLDALTSTSSHELCEAITDPIPGQGWYDDANGEIGDICAWKTKKLGQYTVQLEWSNAAEACV
jgi:hypothetical protein